MFTSYLLGVTLAIPIGPAALAVIRGGLRGGFGVAWLTGLGVTLADTTYLLVVYFGLSSVMSVPAVQVAVWLLGALVLFYLGWGSLKDGGKALKIEGETPAQRRHPLLVGYLVNLSNPIAVVFWAGIYGSLIGTAGSRQAALLNGAAILLGILTWHTTTSLLSGYGRRLLNERWLRVISVLAGLALVGFGLKFLWNAVNAIGKL